MTYVLLILGFVLLIKGADWLVDGASSLAHRYGISTLVIGLTIVSLGTSAPELVVNILATIQGSTDLALGNILGSNITNILLILGVSAVIYPIALKRNTVWKEVPFALLAVIVLFLFVNDVSIDHGSFSILGRVDGLVLLAFLIIFLYYIFAIAKDGTEEDVKIKKRSLHMSILLILSGVLGLLLGGQWIVKGALGIAELFGASETLVGLTIVAIGTSLPELAASVMAAYKKQADIVIGTVVGSNILNIFLVLGTVSVIRPIPFSIDLNVDLFIVLASTVFLFLAMFVGKRHTLQRWQGIGFVLLYIGYFAFVILRG
ncbi:MAG: calcium/sodium antiporter [bacterium]|nr:calcium/sodium antiporter [bacterium]